MDSKQISQIAVEFVGAAYVALVIARHRGRYRASTAEVLVVAALLALLMVMLPVAFGAV